MESLNDALSRYRARRNENGNAARLPIRPCLKKTRWFVDNEWYGEGFAAAFPKSVSVVYGVLAKYANARTQECWPAAKLIMHESGIRNRNVLFAALKLLEDHNVIAVIRSKGRRPNTYALLDCRAWRKPNRTGNRTVRDRVNGIKIASEQYQKDITNGTETNTRIHKTKSEKEIMQEDISEKENRGNGNAIEGKILNALPAPKRVLVREYYDLAEIEGPLKEMANSGTVFAKLTTKEFVKMLSDKGIMPRKPILWL